MNYWKRISIECLIFYKWHIFDINSVLYETIVKIWLVFAVIYLIVMSIFLLSRDGLTDELLRRPDYIANHFCDVFTDSKVRWASFKGVKYCVWFCQLLGFRHLSTTLVIFFWFPFTFRIWNNPRLWSRSSGRQHLELTRYTLWITFNGRFSKKCCSLPGDHKGMNL